MVLLSERDFVNMKKTGFDDYQSYLHHIRYRILKILKAGFTITNLNVRVYDHGTLLMFKCGSCFREQELQFDRGLFLVNIKWTDEELTVECEDMSCNGVNSVFSDFCAYN